MLARVALQPIVPNVLNTAAVAISQVKGKAPAFSSLRSKMKCKHLIFVVALLSTAFSSSVIKDANNASTLAVTNLDKDLVRTDKETNFSSEEKIVLEKWKNLEKMLTNSISSAVKYVLPYMLRYSQEINISSTCSGSLMKMIYGVKKMKLWAFRMVDSSGKIPNGILSGHLASLGDFDGCLSADAPEPNSFRGQYCSVFIYPPLPKRKRFQNVEELLPIFVNYSKPGTVMEELAALAQYFAQVQPRTSICVPSTCSREEIQVIVEKIAASLEFPWDVGVPTCDVLGETVFSTDDIAIMCVLCVIALLVFSATVTDVVLTLKSKERKKMGESSIELKCLLCFSAYTNTLKLLKKDSSPDSIKIFHGMKVITVLWVMLNHIYYYTNFNLNGAMINAKSFGKEFAFQFIANGFLNVETFFFISAVLLAYGRMKFGGTNISIPLYIVRRLWRLTPALMLVIATSMLVPHLGSGPGWKETIGPLIGRCKANWWANLLYFSNFLNTNDMCFDWLWYVPVDTHLYILGVFVIVPMKSRPKLFIGLNALLFTAGTLISAASHIYYEQQPTAIYVYSDRGDIRYYTDNSYFRSYTHITTCCIGLCVGYILAVNPKLKIPKMLNIFGWFISISSALLVLYGVYDWNQGNVPGLLVSTLYMCTNKVVWALALSYVTIACLTGNGGIVTRILSWTPFVPLGRLTYVAYLIHPVLLYMYIGSIRIPVQMDHRTIVYRFLANTFMTYIIAYVVSLMFESPFLGLEKVVFSKRLSPGRTTKDPASEENGKFQNQRKFTEHSVSTINIKKIESDDA